MPTCSSSKRRSLRAKRVRQRLWDSSAAAFRHNQSILPFLAPLVNWEGVCDGSTMDQSFCNAATFTDVSWDHSSVKDAMGKDISLDVWEASLADIQRIATDVITNLCILNTSLCVRLYSNRVPAQNTEDKSCAYEQNGRLNVGGAEFQEMDMDDVSDFQPAGKMQDDALDEVRRNCKTLILFGRLVQVKTLCL